MHIMAHDYYFNLRGVKIARLILLHSERPKLWTILAFLVAIGLYV